MACSPSNASEARCAADALERREANYSKSSNGSLTPEQRARIDFELSADTESRDLLGAHPSAQRFNELDEMGREPSKGGRSA